MSIKQAILYNGLCACLAFFGVLIGKILVVETDFVARVRCRRERCELDSKLLMSVRLVNCSPDAHFVGSRKAGCGHFDMAGE